MIFLAPAIYAALPLIITWGWIRWESSTPTNSLLARLSFAGFTFATISAAIAVLTVILAFVVRFGHYDGRLLAIYGAGLLLSVLGLVFAIIGIWGAGPLRWHAPVCSIGTLVFWIIAMSFE